MKSKVRKIIVGGKEYTWMRKKIDSYYQYDQIKIYLNRGSVYDSKVRYITYNTTPAFIERFIRIYLQN